jgi:hypothetical protein
MMNNSQGRQTSQPDSPSKSGGGGSGFIHRLRDGGVDRVIHGADLYISTGILIASILIYCFVSDNIVTPALVANATPLSISLIAFILASVSLLISFSDERFLRLLNDLDIYNTILFNFEFTLYLSIATTIVGILIQSYREIFLSVGIYTSAFFIFVFLFVYMVLSTVNLVSVVISVGKRKALFLSNLE